MYGAIFDMDGVLIDSYQAHFRSWQKLGEAHGLAFTAEDFAATFGRTNRDIIPFVWGGRVPADAIDDWGEEKEVYYRDVIAADFPEMDGAEELIAALADAGFRLAIGSSGPPENLAVVMDCLPSARRFAATVSGMDVAHGKPHPEVFLKAAERLRLPPARCAVIEDAVHGVEAARRAGMAAIAITGTAPREALAERAHLVVDSLRRLAPDAIAALIDRNRRG